MANVRILVGREYVPKQLCFRPLDGFGCSRQWRERLLFKGSKHFQVLPNRHVGGYDPGRMGRLTAVTT